MEHTLVYFVREQEIASEDWKGSFAEAKEHAIKSVSDSVYDRVEIRDPDGKAVFHHPRIMRGG